MEKNSDSLLRADGGSHQCVNLRHKRSNYVYKAMKSLQIQAISLHELFLLLFRLLQAYLRPGALHLGFPCALTVLWRMYGPKCTLLAGAEEQILPTASGPAKEILLSKYAISGETNNLHPQRACVSFAEKADGTKAFVTATELVAASLQEERTLSTCSTLRGNKPTNLTTKKQNNIFFLRS